MKTSMLSVSAAVAVIAFCCPSKADIIHVPSEQPTVQAGIDVAAEGDIVLVAPGTYFENLNFLAKAITVESEAGPSVTVIDGSQWTVPEERSTVRMGAVWPGSVLRGFTITGGTGTDMYGNRWGGGIIVGEVGSTRRATVEGCIVSFNSAQFGGGIAVYQGSDGTIVNTRIEQNAAAERGGGMWFNQTGSAWELVGCLVSENLCYGNGGGLHIDIAGAGTLYGPDITSCTIAHNSASEGGGIYCGRYSAPDIMGCIISHSTHGSGVGVESAYGSTGDPHLECCDIYGNHAGDWVGPIAGQLGVNGNISEDPLYCGSAGDEAYELHEDSPCDDGATPGCSLIGAFPVGCTSTPVEWTSWAGVKALYRR